MPQTTRRRGTSFTRATSTESLRDAYRVASRFSDRTSHFWQHRRVTEPRERRRDGCASVKTSAIGTDRGANPTRSPLPAIQSSGEQLRRFWMTYNQQYEPTRSRRNAGKGSLTAAPVIGVRCAAQAVYPSTRGDKSTADLPVGSASTTFGRTGMRLPSDLRPPASKLRVHLSVS